MEKNDAHACLGRRESMDERYKRINQSKKSRWNMEKGKGKMEKRNGGDREENGDEKGLFDCGVGVTFSYIGAQAVVRGGGAVSSESGRKGTYSRYFTLAEPSHRTLTTDDGRRTTIDESWTRLSVELVLGTLHMQLKHTIILVLQSPSAGLSSLNQGWSRDCICLCIAIAVAVAGAGAVAGAAVGAGAGAVEYSSSRSGMTLSHSLSCRPGLYRPPLHRVIILGRIW